MIMLPIRPAILVYKHAYEVKQKLWCIFIENKVFEVLNEDSPVVAVAIASNFSVIRVFGSELSESGAMELILEK